MTEGPAPAENVRATRAPSWFLFRLLGALAAVVAAVLAFVGTFLALVSGELTFLGNKVITLSVTGWDITGNPASGTPVSTFGAPVRNGYPLAVAGALLVIAAILGVIGAARTAPRGAGFLAVLSAAVAAAFLAGTLATVAVQGTNLVDTFRSTGAAAGNAGYSTDAGLGSGFWLELVAAILAISAVVLAALPVREVDADLATPS